MSLQILKKEKIFEGKFIKLWNTKFLDKARNEQNWEWVEKKNIVCVLPITAEGKIVLIKNYRVPVEDYCIEFPAGMMDNLEESRVETVQRELMEETGYISTNIIALPKCYNQPGTVNNIIYPFIALDVKKEKEMSGDDTEDITVFEVTPSEMYDLYFNSEENTGFNIRIIALYEIAKRKGLI